MINLIKNSNASHLYFCSIYAQLYYIYKIKQTLNAMTTLSVNQIEKVKQAIKETENTLAKEMKYSEDLRNNKLIAFCNSHIEKLNNMINE